MVDLPGIGSVPSEIIWLADESHMVLIPGGTYTIGATDSTRPAEYPTATVTLDPYYIDKYEVRFEKYVEIARQAGLGVPRGEGVSGVLEDGKPIVGVSQEDALTFAQRLRKDLPTEAEWEVAARGSEGTLYPWGNEPRQGAAVLGRGSSGTTSAPGSASADASGFGVYDMGGNVSEWTKDRYHRDYYRRVNGQTNPEVRDAGENVTVRGGNFYTRTDGRATLRQPQIPTSVRDEVGFRTVFRMRPRPEATPTPTPTPTPAPRVSEDEVVARTMEAALPSFLDPQSTPLPGNIRGRSMPTQNVSFVNASPFPLRLGFVDTLTGQIFQFPTEIAATSYSLVPVPQEMGVRLVALAMGSDHGDRLVDLGTTHTGSNPLVVIRPTLFSTVVHPGGDTTEPPTEPRAQQFYAGGFSPMWNEFNVFNATGHPVTVMLKRGESTVTETISPNESFMIPETPVGDWEVTARYVGSRDEVTSTVARFANNDRAQYRTVILEADPSAGQRYRVATRELPQIAVRVREVRLPDNVRNTYSGRAPTGSRR